MSHNVFRGWDERLGIKLEYVTCVCRLTNRVDINSDMCVIEVHRPHDSREGLSPTTKFERDRTHMARTPF